MFSIGEFSKVTGLSVKTLRFYHERGLLVPARVDAGSGYRYYSQHNVDTARAIAALRSCDFSLDEIAAILADCSDEGDIIEFLERHKMRLAERVDRDRDLIRAIDQVVERESAARQMLRQAPFEIEEKTQPALLVAGVRMQGRYEDSGAGFATLGRAVGSAVCGKPLCLYYDGDYREDDADFEPCMPIRNSVSADGVHVREIPGVRCISVMHRGPYHELGRSYQRVIEYVGDRGYTIELPTREVYWKGPGMIFRGNPQRYLTEIQIPIQGCDNGAQAGELA
jgi:DNA-binding transcriptional MerR regulator